MVIDLGAMRADGSFRLDPAKAALARIDPELRIAKSPSADDVLAAARDADRV